MVKVRYTVPQVQYSETEELNGEEFFAKKIEMLSAFHTHADRGTDTHFLMNPKGLWERVLGFSLPLNNHPAIGNPSKECITE